MKKLIIGRLYYSQFMKNYLYNVIVAPLRLTISHKSLRSNCEQETMSLGFDINFLLLKNGLNKPGLSYMNHFPVTNKHDFRNTVDHHGVTEGQVSDCSMEGSVGSVWRIPDSTNSGIILQFRQHDDLPHLIHEVSQENLEFPAKTRKS